MRRPVSRVGGEGLSARLDRTVGTWLGWCMGRLQRHPLLSWAVDLGQRIWHRDRESAGPVLGSAVAFRLFLLVVPVVLVVIGALGFLGEYAGHPDVAGSLGLSGALADGVRQALRQSGTGRLLAVASGVVGTFFAARNLAKALVAASARSWQVPPVRRGLGIRAVAGIVLCAFAMGVAAVGVNVIRSAAGVAAATISLTGASVALAVVWYVLTLALPRATTDVGALLPGALLLGVSTSLLLGVGELLLPAHIARASSLYGSVGAVVALLGWFLLVGHVMVLSLILDAVVWERHGSVTGWFFSLPGMRTAARSRRVAAFFGLPSQRAPGAASEGVASVRHAEVVRPVPHRRKAARRVPGGGESPQPAGTAPDERHDGVRGDGGGRADDT